jgi:excisionase family DNA binding protein
MSDRVVLSMKEVAHRLGVSISFLYDEGNRGRLATVKMSKCRRVHVDDLAAYIAANRQCARAA